MENQGKLIPFEDIINQEPLILIDSGIHQKIGEPWYAVGIYEAKRYSQLDSDILYKWAVSLEKTQGILSNPNVITVKKIVDEFIYVRELLRDKLVGLNEHEKHIPRQYRNRYKNIEENEEIEYKKRLLEKICFLYHNIQRIAKGSIPDHVDQTRLNQLEEMVINIAEVREAKRDFSSRYHHDSFRKKEGDMHTDEQLVATALYFSIFDKEQNCILTSDSDIKRILQRTYDCLTCDVASINKLISRMLKKNPIKVYYVEEEESARCDINTLHIVPNRYGIKYCLKREICPIKNNGDLTSLLLD